MEKVIDFLDRLLKHNNREWFNEHKTEYQSIQAYFNEFVAHLIAGIETFDKSIAGLEVRNCIYRIYRDTRFSPDKTPYKTHMGAYICRGGKCSGYAGYYFHVEPPEAAYIGGNMLAAGLYAPQPAVLKSVREEIYTNGVQFVNALHQADGFSLDGNSSLSRVPVGYPKESEYAKYLKLKDFSIMHPIPDSILYGDHLVDYMTTTFRKAKEYNDTLNRAVEHALND